MTKYIDRHDAGAIKLKIAREVRARADAAVAAVVPTLAGVKEEDEAGTILDEIVLGIIREFDELERQALEELDLLAMAIPSGPDGKQ